MNHLIRKNMWSLGLLVLLVALLAITKIIQPGFGATGLQSLTSATLPFAFATAAMAVVVIAGGIDLSVASMMAVCSVTAAALMQTMGGVPAILIAMAVGVLMGTINGTLIVFTRVPDIVATLAMMFVWEGVALLILQSPGGTISPWLKSVIQGGLGFAVLPKALIFLTVCLAIIWIPLKRSKLGLSIYATGSDELAAYRSGIATRRTKILAYAFAGLFCAFGGLSLTMVTGIGEPVPGPYLLASVGAVVLGGVVLGGGRGGLLGPIIAVFILRLIRLILTLLAVDPNITTIIEGSVMVAVVMFGSVIMLRWGRG